MERYHNVTRKSNVRGFIYPMQALFCMSFISYKEISPEIRLFHLNTQKVKGPNCPGWKIKMRKAHKSGKQIKFSILTLMTGSADNSFLYLLRF
eukprot:UN14053